ncbi:heme peroxidase family protein [Actinoplanes sp. NPDC051494]|uniref:heme peroxidase family protein n=1 Tax=Actinoplanes sp. NPDC051494 TaxID=3363907 RepID=UPI00379CF319
MTRSGEVRRIITGMRHGGHAIADSAPAAAALSDLGWTRQSEVVQDPALANADPKEYHVGTTDFDYLFKDLVDKPEQHLPAGSDTEITDTVKALNALGIAMIDQEPPPDDRSSPIPPIYTYWGQFLDHDLTAATDNDKVISIRDEPLPPLAPGQVRELLKNLRNPALNLDSVYGDGPFAPPEPEGSTRIVVPYQVGDRAKLELGEVTVVAAGVLIPPESDLARDLPRKDKVPQVGDGRNDENLIVAQLHVAFLRFHNAAVDWVRANEPQRTGVGDVFTRARDLTRWTYQWLCVHDFLRTVTNPETVDSILSNDGDDLLGLTGRPKPYVPLEFAVAAYRFGHSMVRGAYDWNRNFGRPGNGPLPTAAFRLLFLFTGRGGLAGQPTLSSNWVAEWDRFVDKNSLFPDRFARRIDTHVALPLSDMVNETAGQDPAETPPVQELLRNLARRNLLRGYRLGLPTGQAAAASLGLAALTAEEVVGRIDPDDGPTELQKVLQTNDFETRTPLWFYVLREAEVKAQGNTLGPVGSRIVAETIIGQIRYDQRSYLNQTSWSPINGVRRPDGGTVDSIADFLRFAGVLS